MQEDAEMVKSALSDTIGIFRLAADILGVFKVFSFSAKVTPFRGDIVLCFGAGNTRTAAEIHGLRIPPDYATLIWG